MMIQTGAFGTTLTWFLHEAAPILLEHEANLGVGDLAVAAVDGREAAGALKDWGSRGRRGGSWRATAQRSAEVKGQEGEKNGYVHLIAA